MWFALPENEAFQTIARLTAEQQRLIEQLFERAAADHGNMLGRHRAYAATFLGMINTYVALALNGYITMDDSVVQQAARQFSYGIYT